MSRTFIIPLLVTAIVAMASLGCSLVGRAVDSATGGAASTLEAVQSELEQALATCQLGMDLFERDLCFWSFEHGFSKPDPHVFQILTTRLEARDIRPGEILMVGDRLDNDLQPAAAHGWQTWLLGRPADGEWADLRRYLSGSDPEPSS